MELCFSCSASLSLHHRHHLLGPISSRSLSSSSGYALSSRSNRGFRSLRWRRARVSEETSAVVSEKFEPGYEEEEPKSVEDRRMQEAPVEEESEGQQMEAMDILSKLNLKVESVDASSILVYGTGLVVAVWISSGIVRALDAVPLLPQVMEVVGLGFTIWFSYRYLIFKKNREEFIAKLEDLRAQIIGPTDD